MTLPKDFTPFEKRIGITFQNPQLLRQAFTHRSYLNEHRDDDIKEHNERLEFLGDAVLELSVTHHLYQRFPNKTEGELTAYRAALVNTNTLSSVAAELGVNDFLLLSRGEAKDTGRARQYILANAFESIIGALYLDQGFTVAEQFMRAFIFPLTDDVVQKKLWQDAKSRFQEEAQETASITPTYKVLEETGPDHDRRFVVGVYIGSEQVAVGDGKSKQEAEQAAASAGIATKGW